MKVVKLSCSFALPTYPIRISLFLFDYQLSITTTLFFGGPGAGKSLSSDLTTNHQYHQFFFFSTRCRKERKLLTDILDLKSLILSELPSKKDCPRGAKSRKTRGERDFTNLCFHPSQHLTTQDLTFEACEVETHDIESVSRGGRFSGQNGMTWD
jgi:hypothetical protein